MSTGSHRASTYRRIRRDVGLGLLIAGVALLGLAGWTFWGSSVVARHQQHQVADDALAAWADPGQPDAGREVNSSSGEVTSVVRIPRFGKDYRVPVYEGTTDTVLAGGFGHFAGSAEPGAKGNYALAAHRVTHGEPLRAMPDLEPGDQVVIETPDRTFTYELDTAGAGLVVPFTETWVITPKPVNPDPGEPTARVDQYARLITLTTCSEIFHTDNRMIAFGHLVSSAPRS